MGAGKHFLMSSIFRLQSGNSQLIFQIFFTHLKETCLKCFEKVSTELIPNFKSDFMCHSHVIKACQRIVLKHQTPNVALPQ